MAENEEPRPKTRRTPPGTKRTAAAAKMKKVALGTALTLLSGAGGYLATRSDPTTTPTTNGKLAGLDTLPERLRKTPTAPDSDQPPSEPVRTLASRTEVAAPKLAMEEVGKVIDSTLEDSNLLQFQESSKGDGFTLQAIPQEFPGGTSSVTQLVLNDNPLAFLKDSASQADVDQAMQDTKANWRAQAMSRVHSYHSISSLSINIPNPPIAHPDQAQEITTVRPDESAIFRIDLGNEHAPAYEWLQTLVKTPAELRQQLLDELDKRNPYVRFLIDNTTDPQTHAVNATAVETLQRVFALEDKDRQALQEALTNNDQKRAINILTHMQDASALTPDLYSAIQNYGATAIKSGLPPKHIASALQSMNAIISTSEGIINYNNITEIYSEDTPDEDGKIFAKAVRLLHDSLTPGQFSALLKLNPQETAALSEAVISSDKPKPYEDFMQELEAARASWDYTVPQAMLTAMQQHMGELFGSNGKPGWLDSYDRDINTPRLLTHLTLVDKFNAFMGSHVPSESRINQAIQVDDKGEVYLTIQMHPTQDTVDACNRQLCSLSALLRAMKENVAILPDGIDTYSSTDRAAILFKQNLQDLPPGAVPPLPVTLLAPLAGSMPLFPDLKQAIMQSGPQTPGQGKYSLSEPEQHGGITVRNIMQPKKIGKHTGTLEKEVKVASATQAR